ncbi:DMATS type aromatic prenyltransferase [Kutzneria buriramensis]|uniref:DMATS type aromatic prenyltransferase n=2 Tax=Kutzneria buriramensis TaxID=1045776 RepID=A0A3E0HPT1_9PSEU|nr:DMATS type aromatic prenyltransferase [Kutzneria buriramensis]
MKVRSLSLREHATVQLRGLCAAVGLSDVETPVSILTLLLGAAGDRGTTEPPIWASHVSDDLTPVEFSIAMDEDGTPVLRMLVEPIADGSGVYANNRVALRVLTALADRFDISLEQFEKVWGLFVPGEPCGRFGLWFSVIFRPGAPPDFKVYFNPAARGEEHAPALVAEALCRLGLDSAYSLVSAGAVARPGLDRLPFFALDLHARMHARVKVYVSHYDAGSPTVETAAAVVPGIHMGRVREFYSVIAGGLGRRLTGLPSLSSYSFVGDPGTPKNYSLYLPIRDLVPDDEVALERVLLLMDRWGLDHSPVLRAVDAVSARRPGDGVGLIAYASLRLGPDRSGITVYLSSEAYATMPPRSRASTHAQLSQANH